MNFISLHVVLIVARACITTIDPLSLTPGLDFRNTLEVPRAAKLHWTTITKLRISDTEVPKREASTKTKTVS